MPVTLEGIAAVITAIMLVASTFKAATWRHDRRERARADRAAEAAAEAAEKAQDIADRDRRIEYLARRVDDLTEHVELVDDYLAHDSAWHAKHERGEDPGPYLTFREFKTQRSRERSAL